MYKCAGSLWRFALWTGPLLDGVSACQARPDNTARQAWPDKYEIQALMAFAMKPLATRSLCVVVNWDRWPSARQAWPDKYEIQALMAFAMKPLATRSLCVVVN